MSSLKRRSLNQGWFLKARQTLKALKRIATKFCSDNWRYDQAEIGNQKI